MTIDIKDLPDGKELDRQEMEMVRGGWLFNFTGIQPVVESKEPSGPTPGMINFTHVYDKASPI